MTPTFKQQLDLTFLVAGDTHLGAQVRLPSKTALNSSAAPKTSDIAAVDRAMIERMNGIVGLKYPAAIGGSVAKPAWLMVVGDLTDHGAASQWQQFERLFGTDGTDGLLQMPLYAIVGNHDQDQGDHIARAIEKRYGGLYYAWETNGLELIALSDGPNEPALAWLRRKLAALGGKTPVVLFLHYPLRGPFSTGWWFGDGPYREKLRAVLAGHDEVVGIFHGHFHGSGYYDWHGIDVYNVGSPKHGRRSFAVVHLTAKRMSVCSYNFELGRFWWWHAKAIGAGHASGHHARVRGVARGLDTRFKPDIPHP